MSAVSLLTVKDYADLFGLTANAVYTAIRRETLPYPVERPLGGAGAIRIAVPAEVIARYRAA